MTQVKLVRDKTTKNSVKYQVIGTHYKGTVYIPRSDPKAQRKQLTAKIE